METTDCVAMNATNSESTTKSSKNLLYSEYVDVADIFNFKTQHFTIAEKIGKENKKCPEMKFEGCSALREVMAFLPKLQKAEEERLSNPSVNYNIEVVEEEGKAIEMDLLLFMNNEDESWNSDSSSDEEEDAPRRNDVQLSADFESTIKKTSLVEEISATGAIDLDLEASETISQ